MRSETARRAPADGSTTIVDEEGLVAWGREVGKRVDPPLVLALRGELGAGKSVLARAVARGAGVEAVMPSPTFNLLFRYPAPAGREVVHLDLFRLGDPDELWELGWEGVGRAHEIVLVEWAERAEGLLPSPRWDVLLALPKGEGIDPARRNFLRRIRLGAHGAPPALPPLPAEIS